MEGLKINRATAQVLREIIRWWKLRGSQGITRHPPMVDPYLIQFAKLNETVTARSGLTAGSGEVSIYELQVDGTFVDTGLDEEGYNWTGTALTDTDAAYRVGRSFSGLLVILGRDCSSEAFEDSP